MKKMQYHTGLIVTLSDGQEMNVSVYKSGRSIELRFMLPRSELSSNVLVHPSNQDSVEGWVRELKVTTKLQVKDWRPKTVLDQKH